MSIDIERAIAVGEIALRAVDGLVSAVKTALTALEAGKAQLSQSLDEMKKGRDQLKADRAETDDAIDRKFGDDG